MLELLLRASPTHITGQERANKKEELKSLAQKLMWLSAQGSHPQGSWGTLAVTPMAFLPSVCQPSPHCSSSNNMSEAPWHSTHGVCSWEQIMKATQWSQGLPPC